jgi:formiminoglutamase
MVDNKYYSQTNGNNWQGRIDGEDADSLRWHQIVDCKFLPEVTDLKNSISILGFACHEGVKRNKGRIGAIDGPTEIRKVLANLPVHFNENLKLTDVGDIFCTDGNLVEAQKQLANSVYLLLKNGAFPVLLGGGHEITYGHFCGLRKFTQQKIGIINIDAHFDNRTTINGIPTSGTGFYQIYKDSVEQGFDFEYLALGIQTISNTKALFKSADLNNTKYILAEDFKSENLNSIKTQVNDFINNVEFIYLTIDLDAFAAPFAPGVSALAFNGLIPDGLFFSIFNEIINSQKLFSVDIAELNPKFDIDNRTAKLAADLIFKILQKR